MCMLRSLHDNLYNAYYEILKKVESSVESADKQIDTFIRKTKERLYILKVDMKFNIVLRKGY